MCLLESTLRKFRTTNHVWWVIDGNCWPSEDDLRTPLQIQFLFAAMVSMTFCQSLCWEQASKEAVLAIGRMAQSMAGKNAKARKWFPCEAFEQPANGRNNHKQASLKTRQ